ncbi:MAG TPA: 5'-nucleotidase [Vicingaceae bacterium]|nr:5'-nucleotidase [Vicingaceae bacterium]
MLVIIAFLIACHPAVYQQTNTTSIAIETQQEDSLVNHVILPYQLKLEEEMNEVLVISAEEFPKEKGKAETKLGNLVADLSMEVAQKMYDDNIDFCLLNFGGLRTSLPQGEITRGKIFELMPFENELVVVTLSETKFLELIEYLKNVGPQPVSGLSFDFTINIENEIKNLFSQEGTSEINILTSDYLANGGDNMTFFLNPIKTKKVGIKLRDAIIQYCIEQHAQGKQLTGKIEGRIVYE